MELPFENQLIFCSSGNEVLEYLYSPETKAFLILSDVNLPKMDGFELKAKLLEEDAMNYKSIPFVFWSSAVTRSQIEKAYDVGVNGFFVKEPDFQSVKQSLIDIVNYWRKSLTPE